jgi:hypothetical protein
VFERKNLMFHRILVQWEYFNPEKKGKKKTNSSEFDIYDEEINTIITIHNFIYVFIKVIFKTYSPVLKKISLPCVKGIRFNFL